MEDKNMTATRWVRYELGLVIPAVLALGMGPAIPSAASATSARLREPALSGFRLAFNRAEVETLRALMRSDRLEQAPLAFFDKTYDGSLPDLIFYFGGAGPNYVRLVRHGRKVRKLNGVRYVWVVVFAEPEALARPKVPPAGGAGISAEGEPRPDAWIAKVDSSGKGWIVFPPLQDKPSEPKRFIRLEPLAFRRGIVETTLLLGLAALTSKDIPTAQSSNPKDEEKDLALHQLGDSTEVRPLYYGSVKFELAENTINRVRAQLRDDLRGYATLPSYSASQGGLSVATLVRVPASRLARLRNIGIEPSLLFHFYFVRPEQPRLKGVSNHPGLGLFLGTGIGTDVFKRISLGAAVDHLQGELGVVGGLQFRRESLVKDGPERWKTNLVFGLSYGL